MLKNRRFALTIVGVAVLIKLFLFVYMSVFSPQGRLLPDSHDYLNNARLLAQQGVFAQVKDGALQYEVLRTPGYALFLCLFHYILKVPLWGIVLLQILLAVATAGIVYRTAQEIDQRTAFLSGVIVLYSLPVTTSALLILSDTLFVFLISLFFWAFIRYLKNPQTGLAAQSAVFLALATYVRPVSYHLGLLAAVFILYAHWRSNLRRRIFEAGVFLLLVYGMIAIWQLRNYAHLGRFVFTSIQSDYKTFPMLHIYAMNSFPVPSGSWLGFSYLNAIWHSFLSLFCRPGTLKYLQSYWINAAGKIFGYPFMVLWWVGFLVGLAKLKLSLSYQFIFMAIVYFAALTIAVVAASCGERYLVPMVPLISLISAAGWIRIKDYFTDLKKSP